MSVRRHLLPLGLAAGLLTGALSCSGGAPPSAWDRASAALDVATGPSAPAFLLKDINDEGEGSEPRSFTVVGDTLYFVTAGFAEGTHLWASALDGSEARRLAQYKTEAGPPVVLDGVAYFVGRDGQGTGLFRTDGTVADTRVVKHILTLDALTALNGRLYFRAQDGNGDFELWASDGTEGGTAPVTQVNPTGSAQVQGLRAVGNTLFFVADDGTTGLELWKSDGTAGGTLLVKDIRAGQPGSFPRSLTALGDRVVFKANDGVHGAELWSSDGTAAGTALVVDLDPAGEASPGGFTGFGEALLFTARVDSRYGLWRTDGTAAGTTLLRDTDGELGLFPANLTALPDRVLFDGMDTAHGRELWTTDGTAAGTVRVTDHVPGPDDGVSLQGAVVFDGAIWFGAEDAGGYELWKSDGTAAGTARFADLRPGAPGGGPSNLVATPAGLYFSIEDGVHGREVWRTDGTVAGTRLLVDVNPITRNANPAEFTVVGDTTYFLAYRADTDYALWKTDGTGAGTTRVKVFPSLGRFAPGNFTAFAGRLFFTLDDGTHGLEVWTSDGTEAGTVLLKDVRPGGDSAAHSFTIAGETLFFTANDGAHGTELWKTDGTAEGTVLVADLAPGQDGSGPNDLVRFGDRIVFAALDPSVGVRLAASDGTAAGTTWLDLGVTGSNVRPNLVLDGALLFGFHDGTSSRTARTDGTAAGTVGLGAFSIDNPVVADGRAWFTFDDGTTGQQLWSTDGTTAGSKRVKDLGPNARLSNVTAVGDLVYFTAYEDGVGTGLWKSDGTEAGTVRVTEGNLEPYDLVSVDGLLVFTAGNGREDRELWRSDGTAAGTFRLADVRPGSAGSNPKNLVVADAQLLFAANDGVHGDEPWAVNLSVLRAPRVTCPADVTVEATSRAGGVADFAATALDASGHALTPTYSAAPGSTFAFGETTVTATATVTGADPATCTFKVIVTDTSAPVLACPAGVTVEATDATGADVALPEAEVTDASETLQSSSPASGRFPLGTTLVTVTATDANGLANTCTYDVTVTAATEPAKPAEPAEPAEPAGGCGCAATNGGELALALLGFVGLGRPGRRRRAA